MNRRLSSPRSAIPGAALCAALAVFVGVIASLATGCNLVRDFSETPFEGEPCQSSGGGVCLGDADSNNGRDTADVADTTRLPDATDTGERLDGSDVRDVGDGGDVDDTHDVVDSGDVFDADAEDTSTVEIEACPNDVPEYEIVATETQAVIDGACEEFEEANRLPIPEPGTDGDDRVNGTDNTVDCFFRWMPGDPGEIHGCCEVDDDDLVSHAQQDDHYTEIYSGDDGADDRFEVIFGCDFSEPHQACTSKVFMNNLSPPTYFDVNYPGGKNSADPDFSADVKPATMVDGTHNDGANDNGFTLEWTQEVARETSGGEALPCNFMLMDVDDGKSDRVAQPFGPPATVNDPDYWGCCKFMP